MGKRSRPRRGRALLKEMARGIPQFDTIMRNDWDERDVARYI